MRMRYLHLTGKSCLISNFPVTHHELPFTPVLLCWNFLIFSNGKAHKFLLKHKYTINEKGSMPLSFLVLFYVSGTLILVAYLIHLLLIRNSCIASFQGCVTSRFYPFGRPHNYTFLRLGNTKGNK